MMRLKAVRGLLVGEVASLRVAAVESAEEGFDAASEQVAREREALAKARRRALLVAVLDGVALAVLFAFRDAGRAFLSTEGEELVFTLGVLVVAVHLGFRLAQFLQLRTVERLYEELLGREA